MNPLADLLQSDKSSPEALRALFDGASHQDRLAWTRSLPRNLFKRLYDIAGTVPFKDDSLVPKNLAPFTPVRHFGTNSMPMFRVFDKVLYRDEKGGLCGKNDQTFSWFTGPGYYTVAEPQNSGEVVFDYIKLPTQKPASWPKVTHNARGGSFFVYRNMTDNVRTVSEHVTIGKAARDGKDLGQFFVLVRES